MYQAQNTRGNVGRAPESRSISPDSSLGTSSGRLLKPPPKRRVERRAEEGGHTVELPGRVRADWCPQCIPEVLPVRPVIKKVFNGFGRLNGIMVANYGVSATVLMVGGGGGGKGGDGGEAADHGEGADAELHHYERMAKRRRSPGREGQCLRIERVGRVVVGLVTCEGSRGRVEARLPSIPNRSCDPI